MAHLPHQLAQAGTDCRGESIAGVPQIVKMKIGVADELRCPEPHIIDKVRLAQLAVARADEHEAAVADLREAGEVWSATAGTIAAGIVTTRRRPSHLGGRE